MIQTVLHKAFCKTLLLLVICSPGRCLNRHVQLGALRVPYKSASHKCVLQKVYSFDQRLFLTLNQYHHPVTDIFFSLIINSFFWIPLYIWLVFFIKNSLGWRGLLLFILTLVLSDQASATWLKPLFAQYRPCCMMPISQLHLVGTYKGIYGCPSSHATNTYAFAMLFWRLFKKKHPLSYLFFIWATVVSYGRIYGGMHYPLDIWLGAMLGCYIGLLMEKLYQKSSQRHK